MSNKQSKWVPPSREERRASLMRYSESRSDDPSRSMKHMLDLDDEFPEVDMFGPQSISAEVGPGWAHILRPALEALRKLGGKVGQIKQKFGGLRFYWDPPEELYLAYREWYDSGKNGKSPYASSDPYRECSEAIKLAEDLSWRTCEQCGADLGEPRGASHKTLCDGCRTLRSSGVSLPGRGGVEPK